MRLNGWLLVPTAPASEPWTRRPVLSALSHFEAKTESQGDKACAQGRQEGRQPLEAATGCQRRTSMAQDVWDPEPQAPICSRWAPEARPARPANASNPGQEDPLPWRAEERGEKVRSAAPLGGLPGGWASAECGWDFSGREEAGGGTLQGHWKHLSTDLRRAGTGEQGGEGGKPEPEWDSGPGSPGAGGERRAPAERAQTPGGSPRNPVRCGIC